MRLENNWFIYDKPDGVIEIALCASNLKPGDNGQAVGSSIWTRVNNSDWARSKARSIHKIRRLANETGACAEFIEKSKED